MSQPGLFDVHGPMPDHCRSKRETEQQRQLKRVTGAIAVPIIAYYEGHRGQEFHMQDLTDYVQARVQCAPDSPRRILRELVRSGQVRAENVNRSKSLWKFG